MSQELDAELAGPLNDDQATLLRGLLSSREFETIRAAWKDNREPHADLDAVEAALVKIGPAATFVDRVYSYVLGRRPDPGGADHYTALLAAGERRSRIVRALAL